MFTLIFMNFITGLSAFIFARLIVLKKNNLEFVITFFILFFAQVVITLEILGIFKALLLKNVIALNCFLLAMAFLVMKSKGTNISGIFSLNFNLQDLKINKIVMLCFSVILGFGLVKVLINLVSPPFGWDSLNYHFTFPVEWLKNANLANPIVVSCDPSPTYYPINASLFFFWLMLPLKNVFIADLGQVPFFALAFLAILALGGKLGLSKVNSIFAASLFTLIPNYFKQLEIAYVDVMVAALILAALFYIFCLREEFSLRYTFLYAISLGLLIGTKTTAIPFAIFLFIPFLYLCIKRADIKKSFLLFFVCSGFIILTGGFIYLRNFIETGNPVYPLNLEAFGLALFKGVIDSSVYKAHTYSSDYNLSKTLFSEGLGAQTIIFVLPAVFLGPVSVFLKKINGKDFTKFYFLILPILFFLAYRYVIPFANLRYIYALLAIGMLIAFYLLEVFSVPRKIVNVLVVMCLLIPATELASHKELIFSILSAIFLFFSFPRITAFIKSRRFFKAGLAGIIILILFLFLLEKDYAENEYQRYIRTADYSGFWPQATESWLWLNNNTDGDNIAYIGRPVSFPLYGRNFKNNVYYVSVNEVEPAKIHYFKNSKYVWSDAGETRHKTFREFKNYRGQASYNVWLTNLLKRDTDYLFIYSLHQTRNIEFPIEDDWAASHPKSFNLVYSNDITRIYKILR